MPIIVFEIYLNLSLFLFAFGPWPWPVTNPYELYGFLISAHLLLFLGYASGLRSAWIAPSVQLGTKVNWLWLSLGVSLLFLIPTSYSRSGAILPNVVAGLLSPGEAYQNAVERSFEGGSQVVIEYVRILLAPLLAFAYPYTVSTWGRRKRFEKYACVVIVLFVVAIYISIGTNKAIVDTVLLLPWLLLIGILSGNIILTRRQIHLLAILALACFFLAFLFFGYGQMNRAGAVASGRTFGPPINIDASQDNWLTVFLPESFQIYVESLVRYLCQGYYALSRCLLLDFDTTYGFGNSLFLGKNAESLFRLPNLQWMTYPGKLELAEGWGMLTLWHSIYPWIASDVGFPGTLAVMFLIGRFFAKSWVYSIRYSDPLSILLCSYLLIMILYIPANNQIMQNGESSIGFILTFSAWFLLNSNFGFRKWSFPAVNSSPASARWEKISG